MNKKELKKVMYGFTTVCNRLLQSDYDQYKNDLRKFIEYIDNNEIIKTYVDSCGECTQDLAKEFSDILSSGYALSFDIGKTDEEEVSNIYAILKYMYSEYKGYVFMVMGNYTHSTKYNDMVKAFNHKVTMLLIRHIETYLTEVGIDMGLDENVTYNINGKQVNIANDNATINATQNNNELNADELSKLIAEMRNSLSENLSDEDKKEAEESIEVISNELASGNPNEETVKTRFKLLGRIDTSLKFANACCGLLTFADKIFPFLANVAPFYQNLIK